MVSGERVREAAALTEEHHTPAVSSGRARYRLGLVAAFPWEARPLLRRARNIRRLERGVTEFSCGEGPLVLAVAGAGCENAYRAACRLMEGYSPAALASIGFAGALDGGLQAGDLVVAENVLELVTGQRWQCGDGLLALPGAKRGRLLSAAEVIASAARKRQLAGETGALAVDMEAAGVARAAAQAGVAFGAVKSVTDTAGESLAIDFARCRSEHGGLSLSRVLGQGLRSFRGARDLSRLAWNARRAAAALAGALANREIRGPG